MVKVNKVKASKFLLWYFDDKDELSYYGAKLVMALKERGEFRVTAMDVFKECGFIPKSICETYDEHSDDVYAEYDPSEVEFVNDVGYLK
jgi:hypothetical protein